MNLLTSGMSIREIARSVGRNDATVRRCALPYIAILRAAGSLPNCKCGKEIFHPYGCAAYNPNNGRWWARDEFSAAVESAKIEAVVEQILTGKPYAQIERDLGMPRKTARRYLRFLTEEQIVERKRLEAIRPDRRRKEHRSNTSAAQAPHHG